VSEEEKPERLVCLLHGCLKRTCELCEKDAEIASLRSRLSAGGGKTVEELREEAAALSGALQLASRENELNRAQIARLKRQLYGDRDLDVADCSVTVEECRGVIRRMERRIEELRRALGGLVGGLDEAALEKMEWKVKKGEAVWVCGPTALAAVEALRREGKRQRPPLPKLDGKGGGL
jgi:predicted RNase H-like nuclease (RuvC/YqgF family)